jgi:hypothetical protein
MRGRESEHALRWTRIATVTSLVERRSMLAFSTVTPPPPLHRVEPAEGTRAVSKKHFETINLESLKETSPTFFFIFLRQSNGALPELYTVLRRFGWGIPNPTLYKNPSCRAQYHTNIYTAAGQSTTPVRLEEIPAPRTPLKRTTMIPLKHPHGGKETQDCPDKVVDHMRKRQELREDVFGYTMQRFDEMARENNG